MMVPKRTWAWVGAAAAAVAAMACLWLFNARPVLWVHALQSIGLRAQPAPDVGYTLLNGQTQRLHALRGNVVVVNFWATSCAVCVAEMPQMVAQQARFQNRGLHTLAVAMAYDAPANVVRFVQQRQLPLPVVLDNVGAMAAAFGDVQATPTTLVIDRQGRIVKHIVGAPDFQALGALIEGLLAPT